MASSAPTRRRGAGDLLALADGDRGHDRLAWSLADLAGVDGAVLRRRLRAVAARRRARRSCARVGSASRCSPCSLPLAGYSVQDDKENARRSPRAIGRSCSPASSSSRRTPSRCRCFVTTSGRVPLRDDARPDARSADLRLARRRLAAARRAKHASRRSTTARHGAARRHEFVVVTPVFRDYRAWRAKLDEARLAEGVRLDVAAPARSARSARRARPSDEIALNKNYFKPLRRLSTASGRMAIAAASPPLS